MPGHSGLLLWSHVPKKQRLQKRTWSQAFTKQSSSTLIRAYSPHCVPPDLRPPCLCWQDQNPPSVPVPTQAASVGTQPPAVSVASTHSSTSYLSSQQQAAVMKQHQLLLDQQKQREQQQKHLQQQQFLQRQQHLLAEQVKRKAGENPTRTPSLVCLPPRSLQRLQASVCVCRFVIVCVSGFRVLWETGVWSFSDSDRLCQSSFMSLSGD